MGFFEVAVSWQFETRVVIEASDAAAAEVIARDEVEQNFIDYVLDAPPSGDDLEVTDAYEVGT